LLKPEEKIMSAYLIANVKVHDDAWIPDYAREVHLIAEKHGGKYLSRSGNLTPVEGKLPDYTVIALIQFPTVEAAQAFVNDPEYAPFAAARQAGTDSDFYIIDDTDLTQAIPYLPAG
jgi:uncharacterized protein (DUF1330 family)